MVRAVPRCTLAVAAAVAVAGCFRGGFLEDTCEQLAGGCIESTSGMSGMSGMTGMTGMSGVSGGMTGTSTTDAPTTTEGTGADASGNVSGSSGGTGGGPGLLFAGPSFRVTALEIVDPPLYRKLGDDPNQCLDASSLVNGGLMSSVETYDTNLLLVARDYAPDSEIQEYLFYPSANCPPGEAYCVINPALLPTTFVAANRDVGSCSEVDPMTINPTNYGLLHTPEAPCVVSPTASIELKLSKDLPPIAFLLGKFAAEYSPDTAAPDRLADATLQGFVPETNAMMIDYDFMGSPVNLWSVIRGSGHPDGCLVPMDGQPGSVSDVDMVDVDGPGPGEPIRGVFLYMNFTARKIDVYAPL